VRLGQSPVVPASYVCAAQRSAVSPETAHESSAEQTAHHGEISCMRASGARAEFANVPTLRESSEGTAWLLLAVALVLVGLVSLALALAFRMFPGQVEELQGSEAYSLALISLGLSVGCSIWWCRQRDALASAVKAERLNIFHAVMSQTNRLILRRPNPGELLEGVCQVCLKEGHMDLAVVDMFDVREVYRASARVVEATPRLLLEGARLQTLMMPKAVIQDRHLGS